MTRVVSDFSTAVTALFLGQISEPSTNCLRLVLLEGAIQDRTTDIADLGLTGREIAPAVQDLALILVWNTYVSYAVHNEAFAFVEGAAPSRSRIVERASSPFRDFVAKATWASDDHPGQLRHFEIACEHHVIDVISTDTPSMTREYVDPAHLMVETIQVFHRVKTHE